MYGSDIPHFTFFCSFHFRYPPIFSHRKTFLYYPGLSCFPPVMLSSLIPFTITIRKQSFDFLPKVLPFPTFVKCLSYIVFFCIFPIFCFDNLQALDHSLICRVKIFTFSHINIWPKSIRRSLVFFSKFPVQHMIFIWFVRLYVYPITVVCLCLNVYRSRALVHIYKRIQTPNNLLEVIFPSALKPKLNE